MSNTDQQSANGNQSDSYYPHSPSPEYGLQQHYYSGGSNSSGGGGNNGGRRWSQDGGEYEPHRANRALRFSRHRRLRQQREQGLKRIIVTTLVALLIIIVSTAFAGSAYGYSYYQQQQPKMEQYADRQIPQMTRIYDRNGVLLYQSYDTTQNIGGRRVAVRYQDIPQVMQDAMTSIEDKTFWTNPGVDVQSIVRAGVSGYGGASTLTQQLIKNLSGNTQETINRKINEAAMAVGLTQQYPKTKILEMYFNIVPFGSQDYGVEVAAEDYFGLTPKCVAGKSCIPAISMLNYNQQTKKDDPILGLARASLLAGTPNAPYTLDPTLGPDHRAAALSRQKEVLAAMKSNNVLINGQPITDAMIQQAEALTAQMTFKRPVTIKRAPSFVDYVIQEMETALGNGNPNDGVQAFITGGYNIRTTIDINYNDYTQAAIQRHLYQPEVQKVLGFTATLNTYNNVNDGSVVAMDAKTGEILAMVGSANYNSSDIKVEGQFNAATSPRQPGSSFKPFEYATAFEMGWTPGIDLQDTRTYFPNGSPAGTPVPLTDADADANGGIYAPYDYGHKYWERTDTVRFATANSFNIPAIRAMQYAGINNVTATVKRLGITLRKGTLDGLSAAIGSDEVSLLQMVGAYQAFANNGVRVPPQAILDISNNYGNQLYHYDTSHPPSARVFSPQVAYQMTSVLMDEPSRNFEFAGDHDLSLADVDLNCAYTAVCDHQMAAKTGTTDSFVDNWTMAYTPDLVVGTWVGNANNEPMTNNPIGITGAAPIEHSVIERGLGWCNYSTSTMPNPSDPFVYADNIHCGPSYHFRFSTHPQHRFTVPSGLIQGVPAGLGGVAQPDWMLNGE